MRKSSGKRLAHGETSKLVLATIWLLHLETSTPLPVSRSQLIKALDLPETTIDDRLRVLLARGELKKQAHGKYTPVPKQRSPVFSSKRSSQDTEPEPSDGINAYLSPLHGQKLNPLIRSDETVVLQIKIPFAEFVLLESRRQQKAYPLPPAGELD